MTTPWSADTARREIRDLKADKLIAAAKCALAAAQHVADVAFVRKQPERLDNQFLLLPGKEILLREKDNILGCRGRGTACTCVPRS